MLRQQRLLACLWPNQIGTVTPKTRKVAASYKAGFQSHFPLGHAALLVVDCVVGRTRSLFVKQEAANSCERKETLGAASAPARVFYGVS